jgi:hypothetical protein
MEAGGVNQPAGFAKLFDLQNILRGERRGRVEDQSTAAQAQQSDITSEIYAKGTQRILQDRDIVCELKPSLHWKSGFQPGTADRLPG